MSLGVLFRNTAHELDDLRKSHTAYLEEIDALLDQMGEPSFRRILRRSSTVREDFEEYYMCSDDSF